MKNWLNVLMLDQSGKEAPDLSFFCIYLGKTYFIETHRHWGAISSEHCNHRSWIRAWKILNSGCGFGMNGDLYKGTKTTQ